MNGKLKTEIPAKEVVMIRSIANRCAGSATALMVVACLLLASPGAEAQSSGSASKTNTTPAGNAENGKRIYTSYGCYQCHGRAGQGGAGPRLGPNPISFAVFVSYSRHPSGQMPPYTNKVVSDSEFADIYAFVKSLPQPPAVKDIPLLND